MSKVANILMRGSNPACGATVYPQSPTLTITDDCGSSVVPVEETDSVKGRRIFKQFNKHSYNALQERERVLAQKKSTEIPKRFQVSKYTRCPSRSNYRGRCYLLCGAISI